MTIIHSPQSNKKIKIFSGALVILAVFVIFSGLIFYNSMVNLRHDIAQGKLNLKDAEVKNAESKNNFYSLSGIGRIKAMTEKNSLVLEKNPGYVKMNSNHQLTASRP